MDLAGKEHSLGLSERGIPRDITSNEVLGTKRQRREAGKTYSIHGIGMSSQNQHIVRIATSRLGNHIVAIHKSANHSLFFTPFQTHVVRFSTMELTLISAVTVAPPAS